MGTNSQRPYGIEELSDAPRTLKRIRGSKWKIKTNINKFAVIPVSRRKTHELVIERRRIEYQDKARILGLKFRRLGYQRAIEDQARRTRMQVTKLTLEGR